GNVSDEPSTICEVIHKGFVEVNEEGSGGRQRGEWSERWQPRRLNDRLLGRRHHWLRCFAARERAPPLSFKGHERQPREQVSIRLVQKLVSQPATVVGLPYLAGMDVQRRQPAALAAVR